MRSYSPPRFWLILFYRLICAQHPHSLVYFLHIPLLYVLSFAPFSFFFFPFSCFIGGINSVMLIGGSKGEKKKRGVALGAISYCTISTSIYLGKIMRDLIQPSKRAQCTYSTYEWMGTVLSPIIDLSAWERRGLME